VDQPQVNDSSLVVGSPLMPSNPSLVVKDGSLLLGSIVWSLSLDGRSKQTSGGWFLLLLN
jgi:hypothetical protein